MMSETEKIRLEISDALVHAGLPKTLRSSWDQEKFCGEICDIIKRERMKAIIAAKVVPQELENTHEQKVYRASSGV